MILSDKIIRNRQREEHIIEPFCGEQVSKEQTGEKVISYGLSSYGYDIRVGTDFAIFTDVHTVNVDPKAFDERSYVRAMNMSSVLIPPNSFALAQSLEYIKIPRDIMAICLGKSTYARCGIVVNVTPLEPEWEGHVTLEISNTTPLPAKIYAQEGICQLIFLQADDVCLTSYQDREGKYQRQIEITPPKV